jgi:DNA-binding transcriptional ArsR family regulator
MVVLERVNSVRDIDRVMAALSSPVRREILALIWDRELPAGEIAGAFALTKPTISQHLAVLREAGLITRTAAGTSRRYRARQAALSGLDAALEGAGKWAPAENIPERSLAEAHTALVVAATVEVETDQHTTFAAFTDGSVYSKWLGAPVTINDGRFAATMEWGTEVRGRYELVHPPELIVMHWDFEDDNVPLPGRALTGYLRVHPVLPSRSRVEVQQLVEDHRQAEFMEAAWTLVLGRLKTGVLAASDPSAPRVTRPRRPKRSRSA